MSARPRHEAEAPCRTADIHDLDDMRLRRDVERVCQLEPRAVYELLAEIGRECLLRVDIQRRVARYAGLDPAALKAIEDGCRWPQA